jgi:hypothetical protein
MLDSIPALLIEIDNARAAFNWDSSTFLAERLVQLNPSEENLNILAESYLQNRNFSLVRQLLKSCSGKRSRYLYALACYKLDKLQEAEFALTSAKKYGVEDFLKQGKNPKEMGKSYGNLDKDFFRGISMGISSGLMSQKPVINYTDNFQMPKDANAQQSNPFFASQKKTGKSHYFLNWTKKGLNTFTDLFGKKQKKKSDDTKEKSQADNQNQLKESDEGLTLGGI